MTNGYSNENFILRLFDSIKESNDIVINTVSKQTDFLDSLGDVIKEGVQNEELKEILKEHSKDTERNQLKIISRVNIMIACVAISFALLVISYLFVSSSIDNRINSGLSSKTYIEENDNLEIKIDRLEKLIEDLRDR